LASSSPMLSNSWFNSSSVGAAFVFFVAMFSFNYVMKGVKRVCLSIVDSDNRTRDGIVVAQAMLVWALAQAFIGWAVVRLSHT
jgi:hypothetical protein